VGWVRDVVADPHVEISVTGIPKVPNLSPPDTELYTSLADALRRRAPGVVVAPEIMVGFTDNWVFRRCGMHAYGFAPFVLDQEEWKRIHGNDERISVENLHAGARCYTEMLLDMAAA
jgi:acetylornithine deacetylase/succinyl-diaminopimelate desuccinylase-like protein